MDKFKNKWFLYLFFIFTECLYNGILETLNEDASDIQQNNT